MTSLPSARGCILLVRHGQAEDNHPLGDAARALTAAGREELRAHARRLAPRLELSGIATSPLVRAVQTAEILAAELGIVDVRVVPELRAPGASSVSIAGLARGLGPGWALVGHNPSMAEALAQLTGGGVAAAGLRTGAIAALAPSRNGAPPWALRLFAEPGRDLQGPPSG